MKSWLQQAVRTFQGWLGPINKLPIWANEPLTGFVLMPFLIWWLGLWALPVFLGLSHAYERWLDPWGNDANDTLWRAYGAGLIYVGWLLVR